MNSLIKFLNGHVSVRQFTEQNISPEDERTIVTTAQRSPTSSNLQAYSIISVRDAVAKEKLAELCGGQQHVAVCPLFLVFCADLFRLSQLNEARDYPFNGDYTESFIIAAVDAALVADRALIAAQALDMGGVMVGGIRNRPEEVSDLLGLPKLVAPIMGMSLGYPQTVPKTKPRLPLKAICFDERYNPDAIGPAVAEYDMTIEKLGYLKGSEVDKAKYSGFEGCYSWSEHTARRMASDNPGARRPHMAKYLRDRGLLRK